MPLLPTTSFTPAAAFTPAVAGNGKAAATDSNTKGNAESCRIIAHVGPNLDPNSGTRPKTVSRKKRKGRISAMLALLLASCGLSIAIPQASAQIADNISYDADTGAVTIDNNAFTIQTGAFENTSNIPLPAELPAQVGEGITQRVRRDILAPNTIEILPNVDYIDRAFNRQINRNGDNAQYTLDTDSLSLTTQFDVRYRQGAHSFGEGIEVTVFEDGNRDETTEGETTFIRGGDVTVGPDRQPLPRQSQVSATYGAEDIVELRVLNLRRNRATPSESGIYFSEDGEIIVEDFRRGGDRDFNDGEYLRISGGNGEADAIAERQTISTRTRIRETPLDPETRTEEDIVTETVQIVESADAISTEERDRGQVTLTDTPSVRHIPHAEGARSENDELLVYNRYTGGSQIRAGSDGLSFTGQLKPLFNNPSAPPTLLSANATFNPFVSDNEAGLTGTLGVTQFLTPTHRLATDALGNVIDSPEGGRPLIEPAGLFTNRRLVGYVPPTASENVVGTQQILPTNGIFDVPGNQPVVVIPADPQTVGAGNAAYTDNVGGLLIESATGDISFVPQWTKQGHASEPISLAAGEAKRIIYALVPQQAGQNLSLGETYAVTSSASGYSIASGNFFIISADQQPQNFAAETSTVYAVEDTVSGQNAVTEKFSGLRSVYTNPFGNGIISTVDVNNRREADARVGNILLPTETIASDPGQQAYGHTTRAVGFYLGGALSAGIGNQSDTVRQSTIEMDRITTEQRTQQTINTFRTSVFERETALLQRTETTREAGTARFNINAMGELTNVRFTDVGPGVVSAETKVLERNNTTVRGDEVLIDSETSEISEVISSDLVEMDEESSTHSDSYTNFSAVQGEIALGGIFNFGNTPWTSAANTVRAELFARDTVIGLSDSGTETGWRAEMIFHPFGEVQQAAYQYDAEGNATPVYRTEPIKDASGQTMYETLTDANGQPVSVMVNQFVTDDGERVAATVGNGDARGPGVYVRVEDAFSDDEGVTVAGGFQFSF